MKTGYYSVMPHTSRVLDQYSKWVSVVILHSSQLQKTDSSEFLTFIHNPNGSSGYIAYQMYSFNSFALKLQAEH